jgi:SAM-dependent methyltransferase
VLESVSKSLGATELRCCPQCDSDKRESLSAYSSGDWKVVACGDCGFVYLSNPPKYERLVDEFAWEKTRDAEVKRRRANRPIRKWLDERTRWRSNLFRPSAASQLRKMFPVGPILDVGCGAGRKIPEPFTPFGIEISRSLAADAQDYMGPRGGRAIHAPALEGIRQFDSNTFTGIMLRSFLEHEVEPKALLQEASRVLADNGRIYVRVPNFGSINRRVSGAQWCGFRYPDHVNYFTPRSLREMAEDCGLSLRLINPLLFVFNDNINAMLVRKA